MNFLLRTVYFLLVGWWAAAIWGALAWLCCVSIVLLPLGTVMFNQLPKVLTLKPVDEDPITGAPPRELPFLLRAVWFIFLGWHGGFWAFAIGYGLCLTIIGMPLGVYVLHRIPLVMTLKQAS